MEHGEEARADTYAWDNGWAEARRRLELLEHCWDPDTHDALRKAGIKPGWRCLEVGGGGGSVVRWLCDTVGPQGSVVTIDIDTRFLEPIDAPNLEVIRGDAATDGLPDGPFDLVHTRAVLMHIPARDRLVAELAARLHPGGVIVLEECDFHSFELSEASVYRDYVLHFAEIMHRTGRMETRWARGVPARLARLGLTDVHSRVVTTIFPGGSPEAEFFRLSFEQTRDVVLTNGMAKEEHEAAMELLDDDRHWLPAPGMVVTTARLG